MELSSADANFRMTVLGYQFPDAVGEQYDANWLIIRVDASSSQGAWSVTDPCLLVDEVEGLADWFDAITAGVMIRPVITFLEPGLLFRRVIKADGQDILRVHFGALLRPVWESSGAQKGSHDRWIDFPISAVDLQSAAQSLRKVLLRFPERREC